jgi:hypothetical protein
MAGCAAAACNPSAPPGAALCRDGFVQRRATALVVPWRRASGRSGARWHRSGAAPILQPSTEQLLHTSMAAADAPVPMCCARPPPPPPRAGYGTEAISYVVSLVQTNLIRRQDIWLTHSGDAVHEGILNTMEASEQQAGGSLAQLPAGLPGRMAGRRRAARLLHRCRCCLARGPRLAAVCLAALRPCPCPALLADMLADTRAELHGSCLPLAAPQVCATCSRARSTTT